MNYPLSELIDRYSILSLKNERLPLDENIRSECIKFQKAIDEFNIDPFPWIDKMKEINGRIWDLEAEIRKEFELPLEEVGYKALKIRGINKERIAMKNEIARQMGEFEEVKVDHGSV